MAARGAVYKQIYPKQYREVLRSLFKTFRCVGHKLFIENKTKEKYFESCENSEICNEKQSKFKFSPQIDDCFGNVLVQKKYFHTLLCRGKNCLWNLSACRISNRQESTLDRKLLNFFDSEDITYVHVFPFFMSTLGKIKPKKQPWDNLNNYFRLHVCLSFRPWVRPSHFHFFLNLRYYFPKKMCLSICHVLMFFLPKKSCHQKILLNITFALKWHWKNFII